MVRFAMAHLSGTDRSQLLLLPEAVDDYVGLDNPVRFFEAFVNGLDLKAAEGYRSAGLRSRRSAQVVHIWLSQPRSVEPAAGDGMPSQHRGDLAAAAPETGFPHDRGISADQPFDLQERVSRIQL